MKNNKYLSLGLILITTFVAPSIGSFATTKEPHILKLFFQVLTAVGPVWSTLYFNLEEMVMLD